MAVNCIFIILNMFFLAYLVTGLVNYFFLSAMRSRQSSREALQERTPRRIALILVTTVTCILSASVFFFLTQRYEQNWSYVRSLHFAIVTISTVGYGNDVPKGGWCRAICCIYILVTVSLVGHLLNVCLDYYLKYRRRQKLDDAIAANFKLIEILDADGDNRISRFEYLSKMLMFTELVHPHEIRDLMAGFDKVDSDGNGYVTIDEIQFAFNSPGSTTYLREADLMDLREELQSELELEMGSDFCADLLVVEMAKVAEELKENNTNFASESEDSEIHRRPEKSREELF